MSVSLVKIPVAASNARGTRVRLGGIPVTVRDVRPARPGYVLLVAQTVHGADVYRVLAAGAVLAPVPGWVFRRAAADD
jgi:hypothetical protein